MARNLIPGLAALVALTSACTSSSPAAVSAAGDELTTVVVSHDAMSPLDAGLDAAPLHTNLRLALFVPSTFGVDVCLRAGGPTQPFVGPLLYSQLPSLPDGGAPSDAAARDTGARDSAADARHDAGHRRDASTEADASRDSGPRDGAAPRDGESDGSRDAPLDSTMNPRDAASPRDATLDSRTDSPFPRDAATDAGRGQTSGGVLPGQVSGYLSVVGAGTFDVGIVVGGTGSCINPLTIQTVTLDAGKFSTLMVVALPPPPPVTAEAGADASPDAPPDAHFDAMGDAARDATTGDARADAQDAGTDATADAGLRGPALVVLTDEPAPTPLIARARFVNVTTPNTDAGTAPLEVAALASTGTGAPGAPTPLAAEVPHDQAASPNPVAPPVDMLGYWSGPPLGNPSQVQIMGVIDGGAPVWVSAARNFDMSAGSDHTGFIMGGGASPFSLLWCDDNESHSVLTTCVLVGSQ